MRRILCTALLLIVGALNVPAKSPTFLALSVADLQASVAWYQEMLGLEPLPLHDTDEVQITLMRGEDLVVELIQHAQAAPLAQRLPELQKRYHLHGVFKVGYFVNDLDGMVATLQAKGAQFRGRIVEDEKLRARTILLLDNEENVIQLFERFGD